MKQSLSAPPRLCGYCKFDSSVNSGGFRFRRCGSALGFIRSTLRHKLVLELADEALHRPRARFAESADGATAGNVIRDLHEVIGVTLAPTAVGEAMQRLDIQSDPSRQGVHWPQLSCA